MKKNIYKKLIKKVIMGYAYNKIIYDNNGQVDDFEYIEINSAFEKITGLKSSQVIGRRFSEVFPGISEDIKHIIKIIEKEISEKGEAEFEVFFEPLNKYFRIHAFSLEKKHFAFVFSDITKSKQTDEALKQSEETLIRQNNLLNTLLKNLPIGVFMVEAPSGKPLIANEAAVEILGRGILPKVNKKNLVEAYKAEKSTSGKPYPIEDLPVIKGMYGIKSHIDDLIVKHPDGKQVLLEIFGNPVKDENGKIWASLVSFLDIGKRKHEENELLASKLMIKNILDTIPVRVFWKDVNGKYLGCNKHFAKDAGKESPEEIIGKTDYDLGWIDQADLYTKDDKTVIESGIPKLNYEEPQTTPESKTIWLKTSKIPLRDNRGEIIGVLGTYEDITEKKEAQEQLHTFFETVENSSDAVGISTPDGKHYYQNKAFDELFGNISNNPLDNLYVDRKTGEEVFKTITSGGKWAGEVKMYSKDKNILTIDLRAYASKDKNGKITAVVGVHTDITEKIKSQKALQKSEMRYRSLLENAFDGIYILEGKKFQYVNERFAEITEYSKKELESKSFNLNTILLPDSKKIIDKRFQDRKKNIEVPNIVEFQIKTKSGKVKDVQVSNTVLQKTDETLILGIMRDITELKKAQELENELSLTKQSAEFKQRFLANMSHEIRTPLTGILGFAELLLNTRLNKTQLNYLKTLKQSGLNLKEIINLILDYSKIESGKIQVKYIALDTNSIFNAAKSLFHSICDKEIIFNVNIASDFPRYISADYNKITQIINNLLSNSIKFTEKGQISLNASLISSAFKDEAKNEQLTLKIEIIDSGIGIKKEDQKFLFKPFSQIETNESRSFEGTGLGLSICKELTIMLGGDIGVISEPGKGSNFWFTFKAEKSSFEEVKDNSFNQIHETVKDKKPLKILLVEDKIANQKVIASLFKSLGHNVEFALNGKEALNMYKPGNYDLIVMDIQMPVMDGVTATQILKQKYSKLPPIVGLSANAFEGDREKYMSLGLDEYMTKPVTVEDFNNMLKKIGLH
ncbi:MAG: PAS domain S-box protein [Bacteroidales bacterium]